MKALVWLGQDRFELQDRPVPVPKPGQALVRVRACGICATDLHLMDGVLTFAKPPLVFGHEIAGQVEAVGADVPAESIGRRVVVDPVIGCGTCFYCRTGRKLLCLGGGELGSTGGDGGYAQYVVVPVGNLYEIPEGMSFDAASLTEPLNCTLGALLKAAPVASESVLVFGDGPAGLIFAQLARAFGCAPILLIGGRPGRLELARRFAAATWNYHESADLKQPVLEATGGHGPDIAIEASGGDTAVGNAFSWVRRGGRVVLYGLSGAPRPNIVADQIVGKDLTIVTGVGSPLLWERAIRLAATGQVDLQSLVTQTFELEHHRDALTCARDHSRSTKVVWRP